jgi:transcriptional regulator with XRE-family HTH domain
VTLQDLIRQSGLKQREVAERAGLSAQYLCDIAKGRTIPPPWTVEAISKVLFLPTEDVNQAISTQRLLALLSRTSTLVVELNAGMAK